MGDVEAQVQSATKTNEKSRVNLFLRTIFHVVFWVWFVGVSSFGCVIWFTITDEQLQHPILKDLKILTPFFFTNWNLTFQTIFLGLSLVNDVLEWLDKQSSSLGTKIKYWRDVIFCGMVLPFTMFVSGMFWTVYAIDRELVFPKIYDSVVPWWFNHCVHTNIMVVLLVETLLQARRHPTNRRLEMILFWSVALSYAVVYYTIYFVTDRWLYQVFGVMNWWQVCLYQLFIWAITYVFYIIQFPINRLVHGAEPTIDNNEEKDPVDDKVHDNGRSLNPEENGKVAADGLPGDSWSLKFRSIKNNTENSRL
ncbi:androgen-dependent TFPI-regulating protein isoform X2 [Bicyclus anynana]|uniref:Androgen-dependent TFPI-regulating protein isoform X2 n=1 Tax=Bicyclus anynana TaxID=110368 RepID=A0ABM3LVM2_BICAN|nr:androgen-dependent TFPI-regulating protein isoform X2 [Bicyclus anynana]